ncbi:MAG: aminotransferase class V-fold PLP-dependent enzyme [Thermoclostridium sp.]|nr:aminotransferase class V-fold PLP-dependent enzyme [Thermoclostridium sp.]
MIYLDNAATSWPKPPQVIQAMSDLMKRGCANPGRSAHDMGRQADDAVMHTRELLARLFNISDPMRIAFMPNATYGLNMAIHGVVKDGDRVVATMMEHNSVLRPLKTLEEAGKIQLELIQPDKLGKISSQSIRRAVTKKTALFCMTLSSNVTGAVMPIAEAGRHCRANNVLFLLDAAQGAGVIPVDVQSLGVDLLAFPGHKGLLGPQGTGGVYVREGVELQPIIQGGTGSFSDQLTQPRVLPDMLESGTLNVPGIVGLGKGVHFILEKGIGTIRQKKMMLLKKLFSGLERETRIQIYSPPPEQNSGIIALSVQDMDSAEVGYILNKNFGILVRNGLHCAPCAHQALGTRDRGLVRLSPGFFNTENDMDLTVKALQKITAGMSL